MIAAAIRDFLQGAPLKDIVLCELRERDINEPFVYCRLKDGREFRMACPVEDAQKTLALVQGWIARPETFPAPPPPLSAASAWLLFWAVLAILTVALAWRGTRAYWIVLGWAYADHFIGGMLLSAAAFTAFWLTVSGNPLRLRYYLMSAPLLVAMTFVFTAAGKTLNAELGAQEIVELRGRVAAMDDASFTAYFSRGRGRGLNAAHIARWHVTVQDERTGRSRRVEVPGWFAEREKLAVGSTWEDRWRRGFLGWEYRQGRIGAGWDGLDFVPRVLP